MIRWLHLVERARCRESKGHAEFRVENCRFRIVDAGSLNGTRVNGQPVDAAMLANGDEIQIGNFRLVFLTRPTPG